jgi:hypothetical protein
MKKLMCLVLMILLLTGSEARELKPGDHIMAKFTIMSFLFLDEGIVLNPYYTAISMPDNILCLQMKVNTSCNNMHGCEPMNNTTLEIPWKYIYNITWID